MKKKLLTAVALSIALLALAVQGCLAAGPIDDKEAAHVARLNEARAANGLPELKLSEELTAAAKLRAREITTKFSHDRPDGTKFFTAIANQSGWNGISENIAAGKGLDTAYNAVDVLMASSGHRANILTKNNVCVGVATYQDANGEYFWVEIFAVVRPTRDADKTPQGNKSEPTFITSVNDPALTVDGAGVIETKDGTVDYFGGKQRASLADQIRESQKKGRYTLVGTWHTICGNINDFQVHAEAHKRKAKTSFTNSESRLIEADSDPTLPRIFELNNVDVILVNPMGNYGESTMRDAINKYWPSYSASSSVWGNTLCMRTASDHQKTIGAHYGNLVGKSGTPAEPALFLYYDGKLIAKSLGLHQSNTFDQWAKKIASLQQSRTPNAEGGSDDEKDDGGEQEQHFDAPTTIETLKEAMGTEAADKLTEGVNAVTFVGGECKAVTNDGGDEAAPTFAQGRSITHALYVIEGGDIDTARDGETVTADVIRGGSVILTKTLTIQGGVAELKLSVDDILNATPSTEGASLRAAELLRGYSLRIHNEKGDIDLKTDFTIEKKDEPKQNGSSGGCSMGFGLAAAAGLAAIALRKRGK